MPRCPECGSVDPTGCGCSFENSDCFEWSGDGSEDNPIVVDPIIDPDDDNLIYCAPGIGLGAQLPDYISNPPACHVYKTTNKSFTHDTADVIDFNAERYDTDGMHSTSSNSSRITIQTAGIYICTFVAVWNKDELGDRAVWIRKNGSDFLCSDSKHAGDADLYVGHTVICQEEFDVGDYVEAVGKQDSGANLSMLAERDSMNFSVVFRRLPA